MMRILRNAMTAARLMPRTMTHAPLLWFCVATATIAYAGCLLSFDLSGRAIGTVAAVGVAALLSSVAGFAFSAVCGAIMFQFRQDAVDIVQIMLVCSIANQALSVWLLRREIRLRALLPFLAGGLLGVPVGVWLLLHLHLRTYTVGLGAILFLYGSYMLVGPPITLRHPSAAGDVVSGIIGGMTGGFAASPGAAVSIWCGMKGWNKISQRAVFQPFILIMQSVALPLIMVMGKPGADNVAIPSIVLLCVPAGLAGTWLGLAFFRSMTDGQFTIAINLMLIISGAGLIL